MNLIRVWVLAILTAAWSQARSDETDARLVIIIDDIGYNRILSERAARLPGAFTLSVLPFTPHGLATALLAHDQGKELMLHAPMSNINNLPLGPGGLYSRTNKDLFITTLRQDLNNLPFIKGVNNHMGSRLTQEIEPMNWVMEELQARGVYFVDSRTSAQTKAFEVAHEYHVPCLKRDVFLDDVQDTKAITQQLSRAIKIARQQGSAIAIGHPYPTTLAVLENIQPLLLQQQVSLVFASQLLPIQDLPLTKTANVSNNCAVIMIMLCFNAPPKTELVLANYMIQFNFLGIK